MLPSPAAGWENAPLLNDASITANIMRARIIRNIIFHYADPSAMEEAEFQKLWSDIESILQALNYHEDVSVIKQGNFDPYPIEVLKSRLIYLEEKHNIFKHHTGEKVIEINNKICDIKEVLSQKSSEEDLELITFKIDLLFNMINKEMESKYAGKNLLYLLEYLSICPGVLGELRYLVFIYKNTYIQSL